MLYESGVTYLQLRVLLLLWATSLMKACSLEANPFETMLLLAVAFNPVFDLWHGSMEGSTVKRIEVSKEIELDEIGDVLPLSNRPSQSTKIKLGHYVPSIWKSFTSVVFMSYLLLRRHHVTPDLLHFVTCLPVDLHHMLWLIVLWLCFRLPNC